MRGATDGATAVLYLTSKVDLGAFNIDQNLVLDFGARVVREDNSVTKKWFSGLSLLVASLEQTSANGFSHLAGVLHVTITNAIEGTVKEEALDAECEAIKEISLHTRPLEIREEDAAEARDTRKWLREKLDRGIINALSRLPELSFESALASALEKALLKLKSPGSNAYEPLEIVERLLWLSNLKENAEEIHSALVKSDAGIWRAKGLTMTCLGNIVEEMDWVQLRDHATTEMIGIVVTIKHTEDAPLVQKGQAIFLLQRYTLVADRYGIDPHYRETISG
ncbi:hypothetical protein FRB90_007920 [Tulasnella sp. 427]|nr:hypothetical protein FRB90_007920 [Tulasnella sp. 427]